MLTNTLCCHSRRRKWLRPSGAFPAHRRTSAVEQWERLTHRRKSLVGIIFGAARCAAATTCVNLIFWTSINVLADESPAILVLWRCQTRGSRIALAFSLSLSSFFWWNHTAKSFAFNAARPTVEYYRDEVCADRTICSIFSDNIARARGNIYTRTDEFCRYFKSGKY